MLIAVGVAGFALGLALGMCAALWVADRAYRDLRDRRVGA